MHLKRKLITIPPDYNVSPAAEQHPLPTTAQVPDSVIVQNTAYIAAAGPITTSSRSARSSPRKAAVRRPLHSSTESLSSLVSSNQSTPVGHRSAAATPTSTTLYQSISAPLAHQLQHVFGLNNNINDDVGGSENQDNRRHNMQQQPELLLTSVLTARKLSMMRDPAVVAFLDGIARRLRTVPSSSPV